MVAKCAQCHLPLSNAEEATGRCPVCGETLRAASGARLSSPKGSARHVRSCEKCGKAKSPVEGYRFYFGEYLGTKTEGNLLESRYSVRGHRDVDLCQGCILKRRLLLVGIGLFFWVGAVAAFFPFDGEYESWRTIVAAFLFVFGLPFVRCLFLPRHILGDRMAGRVYVRRTPSMTKYSVITREQYARMTRGIVADYDPNDPRDVL